MLHEWSVALNIPGLERDSARICSKHFLRSDYEQGGSRLKPTAVPRTEAEISAEVFGNWSTGDTSGMDFTAADEPDDHTESEEEGDNFATADSNLPAEESVTDMSLSVGDVTGGGDLDVGGGDEGPVDLALQEVEEAANNIPSGSSDSRIVEIRRKLRSLRVRTCCHAFIYSAAQIHL